MFRVGTCAIQFLIKFFDATSRAIKARHQHQNLVALFAGEKFMSSPSAPRSAEFSDDGGNLLPLSEQFILFCLDVGSVFKVVLCTNFSTVESTGKSGRNGRVGRDGRDLLFLFPLSPYARLSAANHNGGK
jgi:hypothetical protein